MTTYLFIDGENFLHKLEDALIQQGIEKKKIDSAHVNLKKLIQLALPNEHIARSTFYAAKLHVHETSVIGLSIGQLFAVPIPIYNRRLQKHATRRRSGLFGIRD